MELSDRLGHALLQLILQRRRSQNRQISLNHLARPLNLVLPVLDRRARRIVDLGPLAELVLGNILGRDAERAQACVRKVLKVARRRSDDFGIVVGAKSLVDDAVGALADEEDAVVGRANERTHPLARRVELEDAEGDRKSVV